MLALYTAYVGIWGYPLYTSPYKEIQALK